VVSISWLNIRDVLSGWDSAGKITQQAKNIRK
jgi:hypothetical protein